MPSFPLALHFKPFLLGHVQKSKFGNIWSLGLSFFSHLSFFSFYYLFAAVVDLLLGLQFKYSLESIIETGNSYHKVAKCCRKKFCSEIFTHISRHFCAYFYV